jgi:type IV secretion system protein VirB9
MKKYIEHRPGAARRARPHNKRVAALAALALALITSSCASFDVEKSVEAAGSPRKGGEAKAPAVTVETVTPPSPPPEIIIKEKPVYIPQEAPQPSQKPQAKTAKPGFDAVAASNAEGIKPPESYAGAATVYDYDADWVYEAYTQPARLTDIVLQPGEQVLDKPFVSDSEKWQLGASVSRENGVDVQHVYVKPAEGGLTASLIINTSRRSYRLVLRSYNAYTAFMPIVKWRYPGSAAYDTAPLPQEYAAGGASAAAASSSTQAGKAAALPGAAGAEPSLDPRFLSFDYKIEWKRFKKPSWLPRLVYDDGRKTYIQFPEDALQDTIPAVFENRDEILNCRLAGNLLIIDKRIEKATLRLKGADCQIVKKRGQA